MIYEINAMNQQRGKQRYSARQIKEDVKMADNRKEQERAELHRTMWGNYVLDEVASKYYDIDCLKFRHGKSFISSM